MDVMQGLFREIIGQPNGKCDGNWGSYLRFRVILLASSEGRMEENMETTV